MNLARRAGVPYYKRSEWIKRKFGTLVIWKLARITGEIGCAHPCVMCRKLIEKMNLNVITIINDSPCKPVYKGPMSNAPPSKATAYQKKTLGFK